MLHEVETHAVEREIDFRGLQKCSDSNKDSRFESELDEPLIEATSATAAFPTADGVNLMAGTAWLWCREDIATAAEHLRAWLAWASRSKLKPFVKLARTIRKYRDGILAAIRLGINNGRMEALNSKVRLLSHRSFGFHGPQPLIALIYLCCTGLVIELPHR